MKTLITLIIPVALLAGSSAFASHEYSRTGNYTESAKHQATAERGQRDESAFTRPVNRQYSRTGDYREPMVGQRNAQSDERSFFEFLDERAKVVAPAGSPNRFGTTNR